MTITKENAAQWLPLVQTMVEGKAIERYYGPGKVLKGEWMETHELAEASIAEYRIKPVPVLRAWRPKEAPRAIIVRSKHALPNQETAQAMFLRPESADLQYLLDNYIRIHEDGTEHPCGVLVTPGEAGKGERG